MKEGVKNTHASPQKLHTQKRPEKSLNLHVGLIGETHLPHKAIMQRLGKVPVFANPNFNKKSPGRQMWKQGSLRRSEINIQKLTLKNHRFQTFQTKNLNNCLKYPERAKGINIAKELKEIRATIYKQNKNIK